MKKIVQLLLILVSNISLIHCQQGAFELHAPLSKAATIDGDMNDGEWVKATVYQEDSVDKLYIMQDDTHVYISIPISRHISANANDDFKTYMTYAELAIATESRDTILLHASSMNGQKMLGDKGDFAWDSYSTWNANSEGKRVNNKPVNATTYEYQLRKELVGRSSFSIVGFLHPFYSENFPIESIPKENTLDNISQWIKINL